MAAWLQLQVQRGKWQDKALVSTEQMAEIHRPQMVSDSPFHSKELPVSTYGLGWMIEPYRGHAMIHHGGAIDGFASQVAFLPDEQIGIVVLSNTNGSVIPYTVAFYIMDCVLGLEPKDWTSTLLKLMGQGEQEAEQPAQKQLEETLAKEEAQAKANSEKTSAPLPWMPQPLLILEFTNTLVMGNCLCMRQIRGCKRDSTTLTCPCSMLASIRSLSHWSCLVCTWILHLR